MDVDFVTVLKVTNGLHCHGQVRPVQNDSCHERLQAESKAAAALTVLQSCLRLVVV